MNLLAHLSQIIIPQDRAFIIEDVGNVYLWVGDGYRRAIKPCMAESQALLEGLKAANLFRDILPLIAELKIVSFSCILGVIHWQTPCVPLLYFCYRYAKVEDSSLQGERQASRLRWSKVHHFFFSCFFVKKVWLF